MTENLAARYACDMHCHTVRSDGNDTPKELIDHAAAIGMFAIGITDHDIRPPLKILVDDSRTIPIEEYASGKNLKVILGYEFSCDTWVDDVHICGYNLDWKNPELLAEVQTAKDSKSKAYEDLCIKLTEKGMPLDWENDILHTKDSDGKEISRKPDEVQRKHIFEAVAVKGYTKTWDEAKLMVRDDPELNIPRRKIDPIDAIHLIHHCGGTAILAHPYLIDEEVMVNGKNAMKRSEYIDRLIAAGLDGIEASYPYDKTTYKGSLTPEEIEEEVRTVYTEKVKYISGGSDYHADHKKGNKKVRHIGERGIIIKEFERFFKS